MNAKKIVGIGLLAVGGADLLFGNTNTPILPSAIANVLTQQIDLLLIGAGVLLLFVKI